MADQTKAANTQSVSPSALEAGVKPYGQFHDVDDELAAVLALHRQQLFRYRLAAVAFGCVSIASILYVGFHKQPEVQGLQLLGSQPGPDLAWEACMRDEKCPRWTDAATLINYTRTFFLDSDPTRINGIVPPGFAARSTPTKFWPKPPGYPDVATPKMLEHVGRQPAVNGTSTLYAVWYNSRPVMGRTPIHVHPESQFTCVLNGTLMFIAEGMETRNYSAGECYFMPAMTKMVSVNVGDTPYLDLDIFRVSQGSVPWIIIEPDQYALQDTQFHLDE